MAKKNQPAQVAPAVVAPAQLKIAFDAWWAMNEKKIPPQHHKEIIWADFRSRGLTKMETKQSYNEAINKYGLKLS